MWKAISHILPFDGNCRVAGEYPVLQNVYLPRDTQKRIHRLRAARKSRISLYLPRRKIAFLLPIETERHKMKKTINGVVYNNQTAVLIGSSIVNNDNDTWWSCKLMKTPVSGRYFLSGAGGWMTIFKGGERIIPLTSKQAKIWAYNHLPIRICQEEFE